MMTLNKTLLTVMSDNQLWQKSRAGDREAFGRIVERTNPWSARPLIARAATFPAQASGNPKSNPRFTITVNSLRISARELGLAQIMRYGERD
jgi:hypothetical protein